MVLFHYGVYKILFSFVSSWGHCQIMAITMNVYADSCLKNKTKKQHFFGWGVRLFHETLHKMYFWNNSTPLANRTFKSLSMQLTIHSIGVSCDCAEWSQHISQECLSVYIIAHMSVIMLCLIESHFLWGDRKWSTMKSWRNWVRYAFFHLNHQQTSDD